MGNNIRCGGILRNGIKRVSSGRPDGRDVGHRTHARSVCVIRQIIRRTLIPWSLELALNPSMLSHLLLVALIYQRVIISPALIALWIPAKPRPTSVSRPPRNSGTEMSGNGHHKLWCMEPLYHYIAQEHYVSKRFTGKGASHHL